MIHTRKKGGRITNVPLKNLRCGDLQKVIDIDPRYEELININKDLEWTWEDVRKTYNPYKFTFEDDVEITTIAQTKREAIKLVHTEHKGRIRSIVRTNIHDEEKQLKSPVYVYLKKRELEKQMNAKAPAKKRSQNNVKKIKNQ